MKLNLLGGILVVSIACTSVTRAQSVKQRQQNQEHRIRQGERSGQLTGAEAHNLSKEEKMIARERRQAMSDGHISPSERRHIMRQEKRVSRHIERRKHNDRVQ